MKQIYAILCILFVLAFSVAAEAHPRGHGGTSHAPRHIAHPKKAKPVHADGYDGNYVKPYRRATKK